MARSIGKSCVSLGVAILSLNIMVFGQSLGDLARQQREKSSRRGTSAKVYTNDDLKSSEPEPPPAKETEAKEGEKEKDGDAKKVEGAGGTATGVKEQLAKGAEKDGDKQSASGAKKEEKKEDLEKTYRDQFAKLRDNLGFEEKKLDVMQRELNLSQTQYYSDPNVALREQTFRAQINQRTEEIKQQQAAVDNAKKAIASLEEELRMKGLPSGWAR